MKKLFLIASFILLSFIVDSVEFEGIRWPPGSLPITIDLHLPGPFVLYI